MNTLGCRPCLTGSLTTGADNLVGDGGNNTFNGYVNTTAATAATSTLTAADAITGGAGVDTLAIVVDGALAGSLPNATITGVENFSIRDVAGAASVYNFANVEGEAKVTSNVSINAGGVTFQNLGTNTVVAVQGNNSSTVANVGFSMATATDAVNLVLNGGLKGASNVTNVANTAAANGVATTATISSTGAANTVGNIQLTTAAGNTITALTVDAATDLTAALVVGDYASTAALTVTGAGKVNLGNGFDGATINASTNTGGLTISTTAGVTSSVIGSAGNDVVTVVGALTATGSMNLGAGDDKLLAGAAASVLATNTIDGGAGFDTVAASLINATNAAKFVNFEALDLSSNATLDVALVTGSTITGLTLSGGAGVVTSLTNVNAGVGLSVSGANTGSSTIAVKGAVANAADTFGITFAGTADATATALAKTAVSTGTVVVNDVEAVTVASGGTGFVANTLALTDSNLKSLTITGAQDLTLGFVGTNGTVVNPTTGGVTSIDGSAATGKLAINLANVNGVTAGLTVKVGAGDDTITTSTAATTLTGGAGKDTFAVTLTAYGADKNITTITDFASGDNVITGATAGAITKVTLGVGVTTLDSALTAATATASATTWFQYSGDTYVVTNDATIGIGATDVVVKLSGLIDLTNAAVTGAGLHLAA